MTSLIIGEKFPADASVHQQRLRRGVDEVSRVRNHRLPSWLRGLIVDWLSSRPPVSFR